jgi:preprotein translocase subunit SecG
MFRWKRQESGSQLKARRGTNMRFLPLDWPPSVHTKSGKASNSPNGGSDDEPQPSAVLASTLLLSAGLLVILVMAVLIVFSVYYRPAQNKNKNHNRNSSSSDTNHISDDIKNIQTGGSGGPASIIGAGGVEAVAAEPFPEEEEEEDSESTPMKALNNNGRIASTSGSIKITLV